MEESLGQIISSTSWHIFFFFWEANCYSDKQILMFILNKFWTLQSLFQMIECRYKVLLTRPKEIWHAQKGIWPLHAFIQWEPPFFLTLLPHFVVVSKTGQGGSGWTIIAEKKCIIAQLYAKHDTLPLYLPSHTAALSLVVCASLHQWLLLFDDDCGLNWSTLSCSLMMQRSGASHVDSSNLQELHINSVWYEEA